MQKDIIDLDSDLLSQKNWNWSVTYIQRKYNYSVDNIKLNKERVCGVYIIVGEDENKYVGSSRDVYGRIRSHISRKSNIETISKIYVYIVEDYKKAVELEKFFFDRLKCTNIREPKYGIKMRFGVTV